MNDLFGGVETGLILKSKIKLEESDQSRVKRTDSEYSIVDF